jgi:hypothetical protein
MFCLCFANVFRHCNLYYHIYCICNTHMYLFLLCAMFNVVIFVITTPLSISLPQWSIFQMRIAQMMELLPNQKTTANSLSVNARACAKFAAPLCFFYLGWIFENGTKTGPWTNGYNNDEMLTAFANFYQIQLIPVMGKHSLQALMDVAECIIVCVRH